MALEVSHVEKIAQLARLQLAQEDIPSYVRDLSKILDLVEQMNAVATAGVRPMAHPLDATQRLRADEVSEHDQRSKFQQIAPSVEAGLYLVPKVIE